MDDIELNDDERKVLEVFGKLHISKNKNVHEATMRKKLPQKYQGSLPKGLPENNLSKYVAFTHSHIRDKTGTKTASVDHE